MGRTTIDHSGIYEQEEQVQTQELTMTDRAVQELSTFNAMIEQVLPYGLLTVAEAGIGQVEEAHKFVKKLNANIEKKRKELKADALEYGRTVDSIAKQLTEKVDGVEAKLKAERDAFDAVEKAEKAAKEAEKVAKKQSRINDIVANGIAIDWVAVELPDDEWMWWFSKAKKAAAEQAAVIAEEKRIAEEFEAKQRKEREELAAKMAEESKRQAEELRIRAGEMEKQRLADEAALAEQRKAMELEREELRKQQAEATRLESIRRKRIQDEEEAENLRKWNEEQAAIAAEKLARLEALKPEIEKAQGFAECMITDAQDSLVRLGNPEWGSDAMHAIRNCGATIISLVQCR